MGKKYISVDIEASGPVPGLYSMLSIGACIVGDADKQFYRELKPLNDNYVPEGIQIGSLGLKCIDMSKNELNPNHQEFDPMLVLKNLKEYGAEPEKVMKEFNDWILSNTKNYKPILLTDIQPFDGNFIMWYFSEFMPKKNNPFGYKGINIDVLYKGITKDINSSLKDLNIRDDRETPHNALDDAIFQSKLAEGVFLLMKNK